MGVRVTPWQRVASGVEIATTPGSDIGVIRGTAGAVGIMLRVYSPTAGGGGVFTGSPFVARSSLDGVQKSGGAFLTAFGLTAAQSPHAKGKADALSYAFTGASGARIPFPHLYLEAIATTAAIDAAVIDAAVLHEQSGPDDGLNADGTYREGGPYMPVMVPHSAMKRLASGNIGDISAGGTVLKIGLLKATYVPNPDHEFIGDIVAHEISVTGYTGGFAGAGRKTLAAKALSEDDTGNFTKLTATAPVWTALSGTAQQAGYAFVAKEVTNDAASPILSIVKLTPPPLLGDGGLAAYTLVADDQGLAYFPAVTF